MSILHSFTIAILAGYRIVSWGIFSRFGRHCSICFLLWICLVVLDSHAAPFSLKTHVCQFGKFSYFMSDFFLSVFSVLQKSAWTSNFLTVSAFYLHLIIVFSEQFFLNFILYPVTEFLLTYIFFNV